MALLITITLLSSCSTVELNGVRVEEVGDDPTVLVAVDGIPQGRNHFEGGIYFDPDFTGGCVVLHEDGPEVLSTMLVWPPGTEPLAVNGRKGVRTSDGTEYLKDDYVTVTGTRFSWPETHLDLERCGPSEMIQSFVLVSGIAEDN